MRILFLTNYYPPYEVGGYEQLCRDMVVALSARGHVCEVLTSTSGVVRGVPPEPGIQRVLHIQPDYGSRLHPVLQFVVTRRREERENLAAFRAVSARFRPEVVFVWNILGFPRSLLMAAEALPGVTVAYWLAGYSPLDADGFWSYWQETSERAKLQGLLRRVFGGWALRILRAEGKPERTRLAHVAVVSDYMRRKGVQAGLLPESAEVIYNGVEVDLFTASRSQAGRPLRLLFAGRLSEDKGPQVAIEAMNHLVHCLGLRVARLTIVGSGPSAFEAALKARVSTLGLGEHVTFQGWQPRERIPAIMAEHDVFLLCTSHQEPFARVVLEAMASGMVVVGTLTGGTGEILVEDVTGLTFGAGDSEALARQVMRLADDSALWQRLSSEGQRVVRERYSMEHMVERIEQFLRDAAGKHE